MNRNRLMNYASSDGMIGQFSTSRNTLGIIRAHSFWDLVKSQMVLQVETVQMLKDEIELRLNSHVLILDASLDSFYDRPIRSHLVDQDMLNQFENGFPVRGTAEVELKPGYKYSILTFGLVNPNQIKIVFEFRSHISNNHN